MRNHALNQGLDDAIIINSCAVTKEAERQARQTIRKARRDHPDATIIVTGCAAQINPKQFASMPEIDHILGNEEKLKEQSFLELTRKAGEGPQIAVGDIMQLKETARHMISGFAERARAFVEIQQGCDHRCTFCIIPFGRGNSRSSPIGAIVEQVRSLVQNGYNEIVLTGVDITSYGHDLPGQPTLGQLVRRLLRLVQELPRLRLSSIDVAEMDDDLWLAIAEEKRLLPHLHLSLQAGDDLILKRMKRRHSREQAIAVSKKLRELRPDMTLGADLIAGFPTENEAMFKNTLDIIEACDITFLHIFPYSARPDTPAAKMPQLPMALRKERARILRDMGKSRLMDYFKKRQGGKAQLLIEKYRDGIAMGHDEYFAPIRASIEAKDARPGSIISTQIIGYDEEGLIA